MLKTATVRAQVELELKHQAEARFLEWGMTVDEAITQFYERVTRECRQNNLVQITIALI